MAKRIAVLDKSVARRWRELGAAGEALAELLLRSNGFTHIKNLNRQQTNFPFADFYAERDGQRYVISVKARNKYEFGTGRLNSRYKLGAKCYENTAAAEKQFRAKAAWLTIALAADTYSAYFGLLSSLSGSLGVTMSERAVSSYECLAREKAHSLDYAALRNVYRRRV